MHATSPPAIHLMDYKLLSPTDALPKFIKKPVFRRLHADGVRIYLAKSMLQSPLTGDVVVAIPKPTDRTYRLSHFVDSMDRAREVCVGRKGYEMYKDEGEVWRLRTDTRSLQAFILVVILFNDQDS